MPKPQGRRPTAGDTVSWDWVIVLEPGVTEKFGLATFMVQWRGEERRVRLNSPELKEQVNALVGETANLTILPYQWHIPDQKLSGIVYGLVAIEKVQKGE